MVWFMKCIWYNYDEYMVRYMIRVTMSIWYGIRWVYGTVYDGHMVRFMMSIWYGI